MGKSQERMELRSRYCKLVIEEIDKWVYGIKNKDFSSLNQFYKENKNLFFKYLVGNIRYFKYAYGYLSLNYTNLPRMWKSEIFQICLRLFKS